jgi:hypothetical protein
MRGPARGRRGGTSGVRCGGAEGIHVPPIKTCPDLRVDSLTDDYWRITRQVQAVVPSQRPPPELRHERPEQQGLVGEHAWPLDEQVAPCWQVPMVLPEGTEQSRPSQQSAPVVHTAFCGWHTAGGAHTLPEQISEQHCAPEVHEAPLAEQVSIGPASGGGVPASVEVPPSAGGGGGGGGWMTGTRQARVPSEVGRHCVPAQQLPGLSSQRVPTPAQTDLWHVSRPVPSLDGRHRAPPQH